jgi:phospholipase/carboxylesterase
MDRVVLGGFSQGAVMSYALALAQGRPRPAGILGLSGFIPTVEGLEIDVAGLEGYPVAIGHGTYDPVIGVDFGRAAKERLESAGADVTYRESPMPHAIDPAYLTELRGWLESVLSLF